MPLTRIQSLGITDGTIVNADISSSAAIASTKLSGVANYVGAWVKFQGGGTTINASYNVSSITYDSTGNYKINMTNALSSADYAPVGSVWNNAFPNCGLEIRSDVTLTTTQFGVITKNFSNNTTANSAYVFVGVFK